MTARVSRLVKRLIGIQTSTVIPMSPRDIRDHAELNRRREERLRRRRAREAAQ